LRIEEVVIEFGTQALDRLFLDPQSSIALIFKAPSPTFSQ
jgi:hypothetical protein